MERRKTKGKRFDFEKPHERRFDFKKDEDEKGVSIETTEGGEPSPKNRWKKPLIAAVVVALLAGVGYAGYTLVSNNGTERPTEETPSPIPTTGGGGAVESPTSGGDSPTSVVKEEPTDSDKGGQVGESAPEIKPQSGKGSEAKEGNEQAGTLDDKKTEVPHPAPTDSPSGTLEQKAIQVIRGDFGNGQVRKDKLGAEYAEIQAKVNEMYRKGSYRR